MDSFERNAKIYVDKQLATMRKYGSAPNLSAAEYHNLICEIATVTRKLVYRFKRRKVA